MPLSRVIPVEHHAEVLRLRGEVNGATGFTWTCADVAAHLLTAHGVRCSRMAVLRLEARLSERGDALIVEALRGTMLTAVGPMRARLVKASKRVAALVADEEDTSRAAAGTRAIGAALDTLAKLAGVAAPIAVDVTSGGAVMAFYVPRKRDDDDGRPPDTDGSDPAPVATE